ncbi:DsbA family protein [Comamonadaceae bacterium OH2545_COT-014]|nr:DsbA family protein [Comamonadaceae bacterium OH2545_COT-014]
MPKPPHCLPWRGWRNLCRLGSSKAPRLIFFTLFMSDSLFRPSRRALMSAAAAATAAACLPAHVQAQAQPAPLSSGLRDITHDVALPALGAAQGDVTIVKFFDYQCSYCKRSYPELKALLAEDPKLRLVMRDLFVYGESSRHAARLVLAAARQGKYADAVDALMTHPGRLNEARVDAALSARGVDMAAAKAWVERHSERLQALFERNQRFARALGFRGTPSYLIGRTAAPGAIRPAQMRELVAQARAA